MVATYKGGNTVINATILDYEESWEDIVDSMNISTGSILKEVYGKDHRCSWGGKCDITVPLHHPDNSGVLDIIGTTDLWICQYCVAENASKLRNSKYAFFTDLFNFSVEGSVFVFTETTFRLWSEFIDTILQHPTLRNSFEVCFPRGAGGPQMVLLKKEGSSIGDEQLSLCEEYRSISKMHERKINGGYVRQVKKSRGSKSILV